MRSSEVILERASSKAARMSTANLLEIYAEDAKERAPD